ncbi:MAG: tetratricopeptide repeat protein [Bacteroidales bacterium]|nr:tetratricopeptide repeat protein [Bacteroidales bacterium]
MKRLINILVFALLASFSFAQEEMQVIDSLQNVMAKQEGVKRVETMAELARFMFSVSFDDCISIGETAVAEAEKLGDDDLLSWTYWMLGTSFMNHYDFDLALEHFDKAIELLEGKEESEWLMYALDYKGRVELLMGDLDEALATYLRDLEVSQHLGDEPNCADVTNNLAYIYFHQDELEKALESFSLARQKFEYLGDTLSVAQCDNNISNIYVQWQQFDKAKSILQEAIPVFKRFDDESSLAHAYQNLGTVYATGLVNYDSALFYLQKSVACAENVDDEIVLIEDEIETANVLMKLGRENDAMSLYQSALHSSETMGYLNGTMESYWMLGIHYNEKGDFTTSAVYLKRCVEIAEENGNQVFVNSVRPYLIADYAHLGHFAEMKEQLDLFQENYASVFNESNALSEKLADLQDDAESLFAMYESQNEEIETLQSQRNSYRLAFFGLLGIALFSLAILVVCKIVRKK